MRCLFFISWLATCLAVASAQSASKPITPQSLTPEQKAKRVDMTCPIKDTFTVKYKAVGGAVVDKDVTQVNATGRYCQHVPDLVYCNQNNPTPHIPCKLISPLLPRFSCPLTLSENVPAQKNLNLGPWEIQSKNTQVFLNIFTCDRAYKMDSCIYWHQSAAVTKFKNAGLFSVEKQTTAEMNICTLDEAAEKAFQARLVKEKEKLIGLLQIKHKLWEGKCPKDNQQCLAKVTELGILAQLEAERMLATSFDGDAMATMKFITSKHDPIVEKALQAWK